MDWYVRRRQPCVQPLPTLQVHDLFGADLVRIVTVVCLLNGLFLTSGMAGAMLSAEGEALQDSTRRTILQAHPEWPPEVRAAVVTGIICAGMSPEMVLAAWGLPTRTSGEAGNPLETWYYEGRPRAVERLGSQAKHDVEAHEWTVSFSAGRVIAWTD